MTDPDQNALLVGDWIVEPGLNRLTRGADVRQIEPKSMDVLVHLCRHPDQVVSNDELIASIWGGRPMGDNPVYKSIAKLRKALGDESGEPRYIETVSKKGYRLVAAVGTVASPGNSATIPEWSFVRRWLPVAIGMLAGVALAAAIFWRPSPESPTLRSVSGFAGSHSQPSLSPDGRAIAFANRINGESHIWVLDFDQQAPNQITSGNHHDSRPRWSPDGEIVLFARDGNLWIVPAAGGEPKEIVRDGINPNWSRDGRRIVFERQYQVWLADASGSNQRQIEAVPRTELALAPRWPAFAPDGREIVFLDADATPLADLWRVPIEGGDAVRMTFEPAFASAPVWSADGKFVYYSSQRGGSRTLWKVNVADNASSAILTGSGDDDFPDVSSDGERLVYSNSRERFTLIVSDPESGAERVIQESRQMLIGPDLSPDGRLIAYFAAARDGGLQIFVLPLSGGTPSQLTADPRATYAIPRWSADGQSLFLYAAGEGPLFGKVSAGGGDVETVVDGWDWNTANGASVSPDESRIIYSRLTGQVPVQTIIRNLANHTDQTFHAALEYPRWSADGSKVIGALHVDQRFPGDIVVCPVIAPECRLIATEARIPMWAADESTLYYVRGFGRSQELFAKSIDGDGAERKIMTMAPLSPLGPFYAVTPEGSIVWVRYEKEPSEIWLTDLPES